ncbi:MAG: methionine adenosyltransferase [Thermoplasmata archaeon]|nr:methionine adenosyltransferase [Thermoplasmata archaeon]
MVRRNIVVERLRVPSMDRQKTELVERKGIGHPDSIADGLAESMSRALSKMYIERYGRILHHNTDETQIVGGQSAPRFGGGNVLEPVYVLLVGRAVTHVGKERLPYRSTAIKAARDYLKSCCPNLDLDEDITLDCRIGQGSVDLRSVYDTQRHLANDTSFGVGYAPYSETERIVLETEKKINGPWKKKMKGVGEDVKVMGSRKRDRINLTVAAAMVSGYIPDRDHYISLVEELRDMVHDHAVKLTDREVVVDVNTADNYKRNVFYLTVTGLSMENGDDGSVGRGNRANGLITPYRPMSMEATSGKNPVTHVGKIYNLLSLRIAENIVKELGGDVEEAYVRILSQIGHPIDRPQLASAQLVVAKGASFRKVSKEVKGIVDSWLTDIGSITDMVVEGKISTF